MSHDGRIMAGFTVPEDVEIAVTTNAGGPTVVAITAGFYVSIVAFLAQLQADLIAQRSVSGGTWAVSLSTGAGATGKVTIAVTNGTFSITWTSTVLRDLLGHTANIVAQTSVAGVQQARGVWMPNTPMHIDGRLAAAPKATDLRQTESPDGFMLGLVGNVKYCHKNARWQMVPKARTWRVDEVTVNESLEQFLTDAQWGLGHAWFRASSKCVIVAHDGTTLGGGTVAGWRLKGLGKMDSSCVTRHDTSYDGDWTFVISELVSNG